MIKNIIVRSNDGDFDYLAEGYEVDIVEVFEDGITYKDINGELRTEDCTFENEVAVIYK